MKIKLYKAVSIPLKGSLSDRWRWRTPWRPLSQGLSASLGLAFTILLGTVPLKGATLPLTFNGVDWGTHYYNPSQSVGTAYDGLPGNASPVWSKAGTGQTELLEDALRLTTGAQQALNYRQSVSWDASGDLTVEFTMRVVSVIPSGSPYAAALFISDGFASFGINVGLTSFKFGEESENIYDFTEMTTFRITLSGKDSDTPIARLYINNSPDPVATRTSATFTPGDTNYLQFGDTSSSASGVGGVTEWESIRWTTGAYAPIPEPSAVALLFVLSALSIARNAVRRGGARH